MKHFTIALGALLFGLCSAAAHAKIVPTAESCMSQTGSANSVVIHNNCNSAVQVELRYSDGNRELMELTANGQQSDSDPQATVRWFACFSPATPTSDPNRFVTPEYDTPEYYCMQQ